MQCSPGLLVTRSSGCLRDLRFADHHPSLNVDFCRHCGTPLLLQYDASAEAALMLGAFDRPEELIPAYHYGIEGRLPWIDCGAELPGKPTKQRF